LTIVSAKTSYKDFLQEITEKRQKERIGDKSQDSEKPLAGGCDSQNVKEGGTGERGV